MNKDEKIEDYVSNYRDQSLAQVNIINKKNRSRKLIASKS